MNADLLPSGNSLDLLPSIPDMCFVIKNAFRKAECDELLNKAELSGFKSADDKYPESYRNNERLQVDDPKLARRLFEKVLSSVPCQLETEEKSYVLSGLNDRLRYCKYSKGQRFSIHQDGVFYPKYGHESVLTFLLYLNDKSEYEGGETAFFEDKFGNRRLTEHSGSVGDLIVFDHKLWHSGQPVISGAKYILRSDFIYKVVGQKALNQAHHDGYIWKLINLPDGRLASASRDKSIKVWSESLALEQTLLSHDNSVFDIACMHESLFAVSRDGFLTIWRDGIQGFEVRKKVATHHRSALSVTVCGEFVITCGADGAVRKWSESGDLLASTQITKGWVWKVLPASKDEDAILACTSEGEVKNLSLATLSVLSEVKLKDSFRCMVAEGRDIFVGGESGYIYQLNRDSLQAADRWYGHNGIVRDLTSIGRLIISCGEDGKIISHDAISNESAEIYCDANFLTSLCWQTTETLLSTSYTGRIESHKLRR